MSQTLQAISSDAGDNSTSVRTFLSASGVDGTHGLRPCRSLSFFNKSESFRTVMGINPDTLMVSQEWTTPSGTPLGGWGNLILNRDGTGQWHLHAHISGGSFYNVSLNTTFTSPGGLQIQAAAKMTVDLNAAPDGDTYVNVAPPNDIAANWADYRYGRLVVYHEYDNSGGRGPTDQGNQPYPGAIGDSHNV